MNIVYVTSNEGWVAENCNVKSFGDGRRKDASERRE